jgi:hypothetical protein
MATLCSLLIFFVANFLSHMHCFVYYYMRLTKVATKMVTKMVGSALPDLGPVLAPLGSAACRLSVWGPKNFSLGSQIQRHVRSSRHVPIERKYSNDARGLGMLLID